jgi:hypothetical protein
MLLDEEFMEAYEHWHGLVIACADGVTRRVSPHLFTYSADYPEKSVSILFLLIFSSFLFIELFFQQSEIWGDFHLREHS